MKRPLNATRPFPWRCHHCGKDEVVMTTTEYAAEARHDGRLYRFIVPNLEIPACRDCGEKAFTEEVDQQINNALRLHLGLFSPVEMRNALDRLNLPQKKVADCLGLAEATLSRWLNEMQIQSKSMDRFLRVYFAFPQVRAALSKELLTPDFGTTDIIDDNVVESSTRRNNRLRRHRRNNPSSTKWNQIRRACSATQQLVQQTGSGWGRQGAR